MKKLIALIAAMVMVSSFAYAADWNFYGSSRVSTFYTSVDDNKVGTPDVDNYAQGLQGNARIGANVKVSDELTGRFEYGTGGGNANIRILYGEWNFGAGSLLVGQTYSPLNLFYSNQVFGSDTDLLAYGGVYSGREAMLRLKIGGFQIAALPVNTGTFTNGLVDGTQGYDYDGDGAYTTADGLAEKAAIAAAKAAGTPYAGTVNYNANGTYSNTETNDYATTETSFPAIEAKYSMTMDPFSLALAGGYQTFEAKNAANNSVDIDSYLIALGAKVNFGMAYLGGNAYMGQNVGYLIWLDSTGATTNNRSGLPTVSGNTVLDSDTTGYIIVGGAKINDMFAVEAGYGATSSELDGSNVDDDASSYYLQATITLAPGVMIIPEYGVIDFDDVGQPETTYFGAKWQINF